MPRVLVTGGLGVNGSVVVRKLRSAGVPVCVADLHGDTQMLGDYSDTPVYVGDAGSSEFLDTVMDAERVDTIIHLAAMLTPASEADPERAVDVNVLGTREILRAARRHRAKRVIYASSKAAYGAITCEHGYPSYEPVTEQHPSRPRNFYDTCKLMSEALGVRMGRTGGFEFVALRFATIYGPGRLQRHGARALHGQIIEAGIAGATFHVPHGGDQLDDMIYVEDVADSLVAAATVERVPESIYNIGTGELRSLRDLVDVVNARYADAQVSIGDGLSPYDADRPYFSRFDCSLAARDLGFRARFGLDEAVEHYEKTLRELGFEAWSPQDGSN